MKAGENCSDHYSVSSFEKVTGGKETEVEESDEEDLKMEVGEACERVKVEKEGAVVKKLLDPKLPSQEAVDTHWLMGHVEYRNWCEVCVRARGKEWDHTMAADKERLLPEYSWDYCFPGDEMGYKWTVLVWKERGT